MKGIVLAGGLGTRLMPLTQVCSKQLLPVYDRPMVFYPLSTLLGIGLKKADIAIITAPESQDTFKRLLGDEYHYITQAEPKGLAEAPILAEKFLDGDDFILILGDNLFTEPITPDYSFKNAANDFCRIYLVNVRTPRRYGCYNESTEELVEKPAMDGRWLAVTGIYHFPPNAPEVAKTLNPSTRGELEIIDLIAFYQAIDNAFEIERLCGSWFDMGTADELLEAAEAIRALRLRHGSQLGII